MRATALLIAVAQAYTLQISPRYAYAPNAAARVVQPCLAVTDSRPARTTTIEDDAIELVVPIDFFVLCRPGAPADADKALCHAVLDAHRAGNALATADAIDAIAHAGAPIAVELLGDDADCRTFRLPATAASPTLTVREETFGTCGFGHRAWEAGVALAIWLSLEGRELVAGKRVLELGSGVGTGGLAAALLHGADSVTLSDVSKVLPNLAHNVGLNGVAARALELDWHATDMPTAGQYDLVLAADCIYYEADAPALAAAVASHLAPGGQAVLMNRPRRAGDEGGAADALLESLASMGLVGEGLETTELTIVNNFGRDELMLVRAQRSDPKR